MGLSVGSSEDRNRTVLLILLLFVISIFYCYIFRSSEMYYDSLNYWNLGRSVWKDGAINTVALASFRGYLFPFLLSLCNLLPDYYGWYLFISLLLSLTFGLMVPKLLSLKIETKCVVGSICALILFLLLFKGLFVYSLSDFPALFFSIAALYFFRLYTENNDKKTIVRIVFPLLIGFFLYLSYNIRTIYFVAAIAAIIMVFIYSMIYDNKYRCFGVLFLLFIGIIIAALPQLYVNNIFYDQLSLEVPITNINTEVHNQLSLEIPFTDLNKTQLTWGFLYNRYDTSIDHDYGIGGIAFSNDIGKMILEREGIVSLDSYVEYFMLWTKYPIELVSMYFEHFIYMMVSYYPDIYIKQVAGSGLLFLITGFSILYLFIVTLRYNRDKKIMILLLPLALVTVVLSLGAVEYRFSLGLYFITIISLCYNVEWNTIWNDKNKKMLYLIIPYVVGLIATISLWTNMLVECEIWSI